MQSLLVCASGHPGWACPLGGKRGESEEDGIVGEWQRAKREKLEKGKVALVLSEEATLTLPPACPRRMTQKNSRAEKTQQISSVVFVVTACILHRGDLSFGLPPPPSQKCLSEFLSSSYAMTKKLLHVLYLTHFA